MVVKMECKKDGRKVDVKVVFSVASTGVLSDSILVAELVDMMEH